MKTGDRFGRYRIIKPLAQGGMAEVYLARQEGAGGFTKTVVIKRILPQLASNEALVTMFLDEARIAANLTHPNVVQIFDFGELDGSYYLAMEFLAGEDLNTIRAAARKREKFVPAAVAVKVISDACDGLHHAHTASDDEGSPLNIVHRDISPSNIFVTYQGIVKVLDFGIAKAEGRALQTETGVLKGKYPYMSPEQISAAPLDARSDVFSLGAVLFELLTHHRVFKRENALAMLKALLEEPVPPLRQFRPDLPESLETAAAKALSRNKDERFGSAQEMRAALSNVLQEIGATNVADEVGPYVCDLIGEERVKARSRVTRLEKIEEASEEGTGSLDGFTPKSDTGSLGSLPGTAAQTEVEATQAATPLPVGDHEGSPSATTFDIDLGLDESGPAPEVAIEPRRGRLPMWVAAAGVLVLGGGAAAVVIGLTGNDVTLEDPLSPPGEATHVEAGPVEEPAREPEVAGEPEPPEPAAPEQVEPEPPEQVASVEAEPAKKESSRPVKRPPRPRPVTKTVPDDPVETSSKEPPAPPQPTRGTLDINCIPWCRILVDGQDTGLTSPARGIELEPGRRRITVRNPPTGQELERVVEISPGETTREAFRF